MSDSTSALHAKVLVTSKLEWVRVEGKAGKGFSARCAISGSSGEQLSTIYPVAEDCACNSI